MLRPRDSGLEGLQAQPSLTISSLLQADVEAGPTAISGAEARKRGPEASGGSCRDATPVTFPPRPRGEMMQLLCVMLVVVLLLNAGNLLGVGQYLIHEGIHEG